MTLNKAKGRMFKSVGHTWNPIVGCTHACKYCWAESLTKRWGKSFEPQFRPHFLDDKMPNDGSWIFVGSMGDLFCSGMKDEWILKVLGKIAYERTKGTNNKFLLQTKNPLSFLAFGLELDQIKDSVILGTTIETTGETPWSKAPPTSERYKYLTQMKMAGFKTFLSLEPLSDFDFNKMIRWVVAINPEAVEIGLENYSNHTTKPPEEKIKQLIYNLDILEIPYVLKDNLKSLRSLDGPATRGGERNGADEDHPAGRLQGASPHSSKEVKP